MVSTSRSFHHSWLITGFVTRLTRPVSLVEQELIALPGHISSPPDFGGVLETQSLALCVCFVHRCLFLRVFFFWALCCLFYFDLRILVSSSCSFSETISQNHFRIPYINHLILLCFYLINTY